MSIGARLGRRKGFFPPMKMTCSIRPALMTLIEPAKVVGPALADFIAVERAFALLSENRVETFLQAYQSGSTGFIDPSLLAHRLSTSFEALNPEASLKRLRTPYEKAICDELGLRVRSGVDLAAVDFPALVSTVGNLLDVGGLRTTGCDSLADAAGISVQYPEPELIFDRLIEIWGAISATFEEAPKFPSVQLCRQA
jgi:hypothetical protein